MAENRFTVLTYNIHKGFSSGNRHFVLHQIREALLAAHADVLFLQETQGEHRSASKKSAIGPTARNSSIWRMALGRIVRTPRMRLTAPAITVMHY